MALTISENLKVINHAFFGLDDYIKIELIFIKLLWLLMSIMHSDFSLLWLLIDAPLFLTGTTELFAVVDVLYKLRIIYDSNVYS